MIKIEEIKTQSESKIKKFAILTGAIVLLIAALPFLVRKLEMLWLDLILPRWYAMDPPVQMIALSLIIAPMAAYASYNLIVMVRNLINEFKIRRFPYRPILEAFAGSVCAIPLRGNNAPKALKKLIDRGTVRLLLLPKSASGLLNPRVFRTSPKTIVNPVTDSIDNFNDAIHQRITEYEEVMKGIEKTKAAAAAYKRTPVASFTHIGLGNCTTADNIGHTACSSLSIYGDRLTFPEASHRFLVLIHDSPVIESEED